MAFIRYRVRKLSLFDNCCMIAQIGICVLTFFFGRHRIFMYFVGMTGYAITLLVLLNAFRKYNEYVTRPVPFLDDKGEAR